MKSPSYFLDAVQAGGAATQFGVSGINPNFDTLLLYVATGNSLEPRLVSPGHSIDFVSTLFFASSPGFTALGLSPQPTPIDLGSVGAPTNFLYIDPIVYAAHAWTQTFIGWMSTFSLAVPNNSGFLGMRIYGQSAISVQAANALGVITSHAVEARLGDEFELFAMRQIDATSGSATTGTILDFSSGPQPEFGAVAMRLDGLFF